jgi:hypothetical protein
MKPRSAGHLYVRQHKADFFPTPTKYKNGTGAMQQGTFCLEVRNFASHHQPDLDIVFVHGLSSSAQDAWSVSEGDLWPLWLGQVFPAARILLVNYPAPIFFTGEASRLTIKERARNLANLLPTNGIGERQTIFICHSLGGILTKEIVRASVENACSPRIAANTAGILFLATPHTGADIAGVSGFLGSALTKDLAKGSTYLTELRTWFSNFAKEKSFYVGAYYETQRYKGLLIVDQDSANPHCLNCTPIGLDADHSSICKPRSLNSDIFLRVRQDIEMTLLNLSALSAKLACIEDAILLPELTNPMYFDVLNLLHRVLHDHAQSVHIISNPAVRGRPCCFIVTKNPNVLNLVRPLSERWPDRFVIEVGMVGALCSESDANELTTLVQRSGTLQTYLRRIAALLAQSFRSTINVNVANFFDDEDVVRVATAAHVIEFAVRHWSSSQVDRAHRNVSSEVPATTGSSTRSKKLAQLNKNELRQAFGTETERDSLESEVLNAVYRRNKFYVKLRSFDTESKTETLSSRFECHLESTDYLTDVVILTFRKSATANRGISTWLNETIGKREHAKYEPIQGLRCTSPAYEGARLKIESVDETIFFPLAEKVVRMRSVVVLSGAEGTLGTSGSPVIDDSGHVVAMTIGRSILDNCSVILAMPLHSKSKMVSVLQKSATRSELTDQRDPE